MHVSLDLKKRILGQLALKRFTIDFTIVVAESFTALMGRLCTRQRPQIGLRSSVILIQLAVQQALTAILADRCVSERHFVGPLRRQRLLRINRC